MPLILPQDNYDSYLTAAASISDTTLYVNELPTKTAGVLTIYGIDGSTFVEKIYYTGTSTSPNRLTGVTRGLPTIDTAGVISFAEVTANRMAHPANVRIAMTDNVHYLSRALSVLNGSEEMGGVMQLPATRTIDSARDVVDFEYVNGLTASGLGSFLVTQNGADPSLTINVAAGYYVSGATSTSYAGASAQAVTPSQTNYVQLTRAGALVINTSGFVAGNISLAEVVTSGTDITSITDRRAILGMPLTPQMATDLANIEASAAGDTYYNNATNLTRLPIGTASQFLRVNAGATAPEWATFTAPFFGNATDGNGTIAAGTTTLTRDTYYNNLTIQTGGILNPGGFKIFVAGTLTYEGTGMIAANGGNGGAGGNAAGNTNGIAGTAGAAAHAAGSLPAAPAGGAGGTATANATNGTDAAKSLGVAGAAGGVGADPDGSGLFSAGSAGALSGTVFNTVNNVVNAFTLLDQNPTVAALQGSAGSGGGGGGGSGSAGSNNGGGGGGGAGGAGGFVWLAARNIVTVNGNDYIRARGGNGGAGGNASANGGAGGGGGAGSGGVVIRICETITGTGTISVIAGTAGAAGTGGLNSASPGAAGTAGTTYLLQI